MVPSLCESVARQARQHCASRGYVSGPNWNPLEPHDPVSALAMARFLIGSGWFDHYLAVAPEGHAYGFFFERLGVPVHEVFVDYPPREVTRADDLPAVAGKRVLLIEDDLVSGTSLRLLVAALQPHGPASVALYLGRRADSQFPENAPPPITSIYLAETHLNPAHRAEDEADFLRVFAENATSTDNSWKNERASS